MSKFTTSRGVTVEILAIQTLWEKFAAANNPPDPPTYEAKGLTGTERFALTQEIVDKAGECTETEKAAWQSYQEQLAAHNAAVADKQKRMVFLHGIRFDYPTDDAWVKAQEELGIAVPADPIERRLHYIETEVCGGIGDFLEIVKRCMIEGLPEEQFRQAEELFRRSLGRYTAEGPADRQGQVEGELPLPEGGGGAQDGAPAARAVRRAAGRGPGGDRRVPARMRSDGGLRDAAARGRNAPRG